MARWRIAGVNFDHFHMGDLLRLAHEHPEAEIVGICDEDPSQMTEVQAALGIPQEAVYTDLGACLQQTEPDLVILCPAAARHAEWTANVAAAAPHGVHLLIEKPFAASLAEADQMIDIMHTMMQGKQLAINWPLRWVASHAKAHALIEEGLIGEVREVHFYDGNRGPLWHGADKIEQEPTTEDKDASWFYRESEGGGSLQDYLGYGTTLGTWFHNGKRPTEVTTMWHQPAGLEVDEQSVTILHYESGLSTCQTRWGTFSDPWTHQPNPRCGFVIVGSEGTIASEDYADHVRVQTQSHPEGVLIAAPELTGAGANPIAYFLDCLENDTTLTGPLSIETSRIGQEIVDAAVKSALTGRTVTL